MKQLYLLLSVLIFTCTTPLVWATAGCESGHWIVSVSDNGQIIKLEDGSIWMVDTVDAIDSMLWLPTTDIIACDDKLINVDDNETVTATRIR